MKKSMLGVLILCASISTLAFRGLRGEDADAVTHVPVKTGQVVGHMVGRLLLDRNGSIQFIGYYPYIAGLPGSLFSGTPSERTAYFTFRSTSFGADVLPNGNIVHVFSIPANGVSNLLNVYLNEQPNQSFDDPDSFSSGRLIAQYQTERSMVTYSGSGAVDMGTVDLVSSTNFKFQGQVFNLGEVKSATITLIFAASPLSGSFTSGSAVLPFGGSLVAVGEEDERRHNEQSHR